MNPAQQRVRQAPFAMRNSSISTHRGIDESDESDAADLDDLTATLELWNRVLAVADIGVEALSLRWFPFSQSMLERARLWR